MTATKKKKTARKVKTSKRTGRVTRNTVTRADVEGVERVVKERDGLIDEIKAETDAGFFSGVGMVAGALTAGAVGAVKTTLDIVLDGIAAAGMAVWAFMGRVFDSAFAFVGAVLSWVSSAIAAATGKAREALLSVRERISSMNIDMVAASGNLIKFMVAAAALGIGVTAGVAVGTVTAGVAVGGLINVGVATVSALWWGKVVGLIMAAISAGVVADVVYTLGSAGINDAMLAAAYDEAQARKATVATA